MKRNHKHTWAVVVTGSHLQDEVSRWHAGAYNNMETQQCADCGQFRYGCRDTDGVVRLWDGYRKPAHISERCVSQDISTKFATWVNER